MKVLIIGAGLFGCCAASELAAYGHDVTLVEQDSVLMSRASKCNHNRIHFGYHYPRSVLTAKQSIEGLLSFLIHFKDAIVTDFPNYYAIAKEGSYVSSNDFVRFCEDAGISYIEEFPEEKFLNRSLLESSFKVNEPVFDYFALREIVKSKLAHKNIQLFLSTKCNGIRKYDKSILLARLSSAQGERIEEFEFVINATYAGLNNINKSLGVKELDLLFEDVMIPVLDNIDVPPIGLTIMDGEFCTIMPRGNKEQFLLYHVKSSVLNRSKNVNDVTMSLGEDASNIRQQKILKDCQVFMPFIENANILDCYRTTRAVVENKTDARLSELHTYEGYNNYVSILSGKISTSMKTAIQIRTLLSGKALSAPCVI